MIPTPHIEVDKKGVIAETIILPGDPLRAKFIAEKYLKDPIQFNAVRNMFGYTGGYKGKKISVMGSGMGMASMGIYSYELIHFYDVKNLIRIGSCGSLQEDVNLYDIVISMSTSMDTDMNMFYKSPGLYAPTASWELLHKAASVAQQKGIEVRIGNTLCTGAFYTEDLQAWKVWAEMGVLAVEMEASALYMNAARAGVNALCIFTVSDSLVTHEQTSAKERQNSFTQMMEIALEMV